MALFILNKSPSSLKMMLSVVSLILLLNILVLFLYFRSQPHHNQPPSSTSFHILTNQHQFTSSSPSLCVITRIHGPQIPYFPLFALALHLSGLDRLRIYVVNTDSRTNLVHLRQTIDFINNLVQVEHFVALLDLGPLPEINQFGYGVTDQALRYLYDQQANNTSNCDYVMVTNADNLYTKNFAVKVLPHMKDNYDIIGWSFVSHHQKSHFQEKFNETNNVGPKFIDDGTEKCTPTTLHIGVLDLGAAMYRFGFLFKHRLYFRSDDDAYHGGSDGFFIEQAIQHTKHSVVLRQTIFIHQ